MSTKKNNIIEDILTRLKFSKSFNTWREVAGYLGEREATISIWRARGSPSAKEKILYRCKGDISDKFLLTGEGPMYDPMAEEMPPSVTLTGHGSIQAGRNISGSPKLFSPTGENNLLLDEEELLLIERLREFGGKRMLRKFLASLDKLEGEFSDEQ